MGKAAASSKRRGEEINDLRSAVAEVVQDLKQLSVRVAELAEAAAAIDPGEMAQQDGRRAASARQTAAHPTEFEEIVVTVRPLPELAMAAMAETTLRGLSAVRQLISVEREADWARFRLEVLIGADLVSEIRAAMPVSFRVTQSGPGELSLDLKWLWGAGS